MSLSNWESSAVIASTLISLVALLRTFNIRRPHVFLHDLKDLAIGFGRLGPLLTFRGTLESRNKDSLVSLITTKVVRNKDKAEHLFTWHSWQQPLISKDPLPMALASAFLLAEKQATNAFLTLQDEGTHRLFEPKLIQLRSAFNKYLQDKNLSLDQSNQAQWPAIFKDFNDSEPQPLVGQQKLHLETYGLLQRVMYWEAGDYTAQIEIHTSNPDKVHKFEFSFSLTDLDYKNLIGNLIGIMWDYSGIPIFQFNTARPVVKNFRKITN